MMIYLASPYTHADPFIKEERFQAVCKAASFFMKNKYMILSPIAHTHPIALYGLPGGWEYWEKYDRELLSKCDALWVLAMSGWKESVGTQAEIRIAQELGMPISYVNPETYAISVSIPTSP